MKTESFKVLEVGRKYLTRDGKVVKIKSEDKNTSYPFNGDNDASYTPNGLWVVSHIDRLDLIRRIPKPTTLSILRWGVLWKTGNNKGLLLTKCMGAKLPYVFYTRKDARRFAKHGLFKVKPVKVKCTYEVIE